MGTMKKKEKELEVRYSDIEYGGKLGESGLGATYEGFWNSKHVAIKVVAKRLVALSKLEPNEIVRLGSLKHDNLVQFYGTSLQDQILCFLTEFAPNGSVHDYIHVKGHKPEVKESIRWAEQTAEGMHYLHSLRIFHRNLKPSNVLLTEELDAKICGFGFAKFLEYAAIEELADTYRWMAPEIMRHEPATFYSDVFSYGMLLWELLSHKQPFAELPAAEVCNEVLHRKRPPIPRPTPFATHYLYKLMQMCWKADHKARPSFTKILAALKNKEFLDVTKIEMNELQISEKTLGKGGFGVVKKGKWKSRNVDVAIKQVLTGLTEEVELISVLDHPNIIQFYGAVQTPNYNCLVTEFAKEGSLYRLLYQKRKAINMDQSLLWAKQIAEGMNYLHEHELVHRDLKSENVLLTTETPTMPGMAAVTKLSSMTVKICDFGCAKSLVGCDAQTVSKMGTLRWMAPEILRGEHASFPCDVFSYGMVMWELLEHKEPFENDSEVDAATKIKGQERPLIPDYHGQYLVELLKMCWEDTPEARPTFTVILSTLEGHGTTSI